MTRLPIALFLLLGAMVVHAQDLGVYGRVYPIKEKDAIQSMKDAVSKKLANGGKEKMIKDAQDRYIASLNNVKLPAGMRHARTTQSKLVDLSQTLDRTYTDGRGRVVAKAGTKVNPLAIIPLNKRLFFIDGRDAKQIALTKAQARPMDKVILMAGSVYKASDALQRHVYLDIPGLHKRMKIQNLPSIVSQRGDMLLVQEIAP